LAANEIVFSSALGMADVEQGVPLKTTSVDRLASLSKPITGRIIMDLLVRFSIFQGKSSCIHQEALHVAGLIQAPFALLHGLHAVASAVDDFLARAAKQRWSPRPILEHLAQTEAAERAHRSLERRLRLSEIKKLEWVLPPLVICPVGAH
jgi:hypothetical protein